MKDIVVARADELEKIKKAILKDGKEKLQVVSDFDRTLTTAFVNGRFVPGLIAILREYNYLTENYSEKAKTLYNKYHPIELSSMPLAEKKKAMHEWWHTHYKLLVQSKLNLKDIEKVVKSGKVKFRKGTLEFLDFLYEHKIPLVILSSGGLGIESILMYFENEKRRYDNIYIVSNSFKWDKNGYLVAVKEPIIHSMNKDETSVKEFPFYNKIKDRKNVLLLGDMLEDIEMVRGFSYEKLIKIGFLNENVQENLERYERIYDVVILNDGTFDYVNKLIREIVK